MIQLSKRCPSSNCLTHLLTGRGLRWCQCQTVQRQNSFIQWQTYRRGTWWCWCHVFWGFCFAPAARMRCIWQSNVEVLELNSPLTFTALEHTAKMTVNTQQACTLKGNTLPKYKPLLWSRSISCHYSRYIIADSECSSPQKLLTRAPTRALDAHWRPRQMVEARCVKSTAMLAAASLPLTKIHHHFISLVLQVSAHKNLNFNLIMVLDENPVDQRFFTGDH